jgi:hypothetical protein
MTFSSLGGLFDGPLMGAILKLRLVFSSWLSTAFYPDRAGTLFFCERKIKDGTRYNQKIDCGQRFWIH